MDTARAILIAAVYSRFDGNLFLDESADEVLLQAADVVDQFLLQDETNRTNRERADAAKLRAARSAHYGKETPS